jgi:hypothetical protein
LLSNPPEAEQSYISLHCKFETLRLRRIKQPNLLPFRNARFYREARPSVLFTEKIFIRTRNPGFDSSELSLKVLDSQNFSILTYIMT